MDNLQLQKRIEDLEHKFKTHIHNGVDSQTLAISKTTRYIKDAFTTNNSATTIINLLTLSLSQSVMIYAKIVGRRTGGSSGADGDSASYILHGLVKRASSGNASIVGQSIVSSFEDQAGWTVAIALSTNDILIQVTGATNNDISWSGEFFWILQT